MRCGAFTRGFKVSLVLEWNMIGIRLHKHLFGQLGTVGMRLQRRGAHLHSCGQDLEILIHFFQ